MAGIFSGLEKMGLGNISGGDLFEDPSKKEVNVKKNEPQKKLVLANEEDYLFDKKYKCPICDSDFEAKTVRTGKVLLCLWQLRYSVQKERRVVL